jgi:hypothetical protein
LEASIGGFGEGGRVGGFGRKTIGFVKSSGFGIFQVNRLLF